MLLAKKLIVTLASYTCEFVECTVLETEQNTDIYNCTSMHTLRHAHHQHEAGR